MRLDFFAFTHHDGSLDCIVQLTNVALPVSGHQSTNCFAGGSRDSLTHRIAMPHDEVFDKFRDIVESFTQRWIRILTPSSR